MSWDYGIHDNFAKKGIYLASIVVYFYNMKNGWEEKEKQNRACPPEYN